MKTGTGPHMKDVQAPNWLLALIILITLLTVELILGPVLVNRQTDTALQTCGEGWYHTLAALNEALIRLEGLQ